uniref:Uncharacterized protein n=1 Tax=Solanum tuberosum TaxID=4113 RepID=M1D835_SOLTU
MSIPLLNAPFLLNCVEPKFNSSRILNDFVEAKISTEGSAQFQLMLGDIVISMEPATRQVEERRRSSLDEINILLVGSTHF